MGRLAWSPEQQVSHTSWCELRAPPGTLMKPVPSVHSLLAKREHRYLESIGGDGWDVGLSSNKGASCAPPDTLLPWGPLGELPAEGQREMAEP